MNPSTVRHGRIRTAVAINFSGSPLAMLTKMKTRSGVPFLEHGEFHAGERPRADFDRGGLQPRVGVDWNNPASQSDRRARGGKTDLWDAAMPTRIRVEREAK